VLLWRWQRQAEAKTGSSLVLFKPVNEYGSFGFAMKALASTGDFDLRKAIPIRRLISFASSEGRCLLSVKRSIFNQKHSLMSPKEGKAPVAKLKANKPRAKRSARKIRTQKQQAKGLRQINWHAAGIDVGSQEHYVAVSPKSVPEGQSAVRSFSAFTSGLDALVEWLKECGVTTVAMESTGVYWIPLAQKLGAAGIEYVLANARHVRNVPGRKTDVKDCQWLQELHSYGLVSGSFRPDDEVCKLRSLQRHRGNIVSSASAEIQHMQKALQQMNLHLHHVVSDINGTTGLRILDAILDGERDPKALVKLRDPRVSKSTVPEMEEALKGDYRPEHLFVLGQSLETYRFHLAQIEKCDQQIETVLKSLVAKAQASEPTGGQDEPPPGTPGTRIYRLIPEGAPSAPSQGSGVLQRQKRQKKPARNQPSADFRAHLRTICGVDLTAVIGLNILSVLILISEIGTDMSRWRNAKAFCSWLGLCPGNKISGGKVLSSRSRRVVNRAATILRIAASTLGRSDCCLGHFYRRKKAHLGPAKAITATARKLACIVYYMLKFKQEYREPDPAAYQAKIQRGRLSNLKKQAATLGFDLVATASIPA
jgi:transposase